MKNDNLDAMIAALRPAAVDDLADAAYERRREPGLVRAQGGSGRIPSGATPRRRPVRRLAFATGAVAAVVAAALVAPSVLSGGHQGRSDGTTAQNGATARNGAIGTRTFLLASADTVARQPATHGTCWYSRTRRWTWDLGPGPVRLGTATPGSARHGAAKSTGTGVKHTYRAQTSSSAENWSCTRTGTDLMRFGTRLPLDIQVAFPTKGDEASWRAAGSPPLQVNGGTTTTRPFTTTYEQGSHLVNPDIGSHEIEWKSLSKLPTTKSGLETYLRRLWRLDRSGGANGYVAPADFGEYVFVSAWDLFVAPTTPGTRSALYEILADIPSVQVTGRVTDREGRPGVAITDRNTDVRLTVDQATARLLDYEEVPTVVSKDTTMDSYLAFEGQGWVNKIGALPTP